MNKKSKPKSKKFEKSFSEADREIFDDLEKKAVAVPISAAFLPAK